MSHKLSTYLVLEVGSIISLLTRTGVLAMWQALQLTRQKVKMNDEKAFCALNALFTWRSCNECYASYAGYASQKATGGLIRRKCRKGDRNRPWMRRRSHGEHPAVGGSSREEQISLMNLRNKAAATEATGVLICIASLLRCDRSGLA
jgi:hypothetical protein